MIIEVFINIVMFFIDIIIKFIPTIPNLPESMINGINSFINLVISNGANILFILFRKESVLITIPIIIFIMSAEYIYKFILWIIRKIPFLNIK